MQKLREEHHSHLTSSVLKILAQNRITTILEFLQEDTEKISYITRLQFAQVLDIKNSIFNKYSAPLNTATYMYEKTLQTKTYISTGINSLNAILGGGIPVGHITEICGLADSGKSQLCFQLAINCVRNSDDSVLYIDSKGDFSAVRIQQILSACRYSHKEMALIMFKIRVVRVWNMDEIIELFKNLKSRKISIENLSLIIIDSLPCLMFQYLGDNNKLGLSLLNIFVNYSRFLAKEFSLGVVCVNIQTRWIDQDVSDLEDDGEQSTSTFKETSQIEKKNRCLGQYWQQIPMIVLLLEKTHEYHEDDNTLNIDLTMINSSYGWSNKKCILKLNHLGVIDF